ncbi:MAG: efflux RND transporter permease subunit [Pseudomonadota bacterium]
MFFERMFDRMLAGYEWGLKRVLQHRLLTLCGFIVTLMITALLFIFIPKGFFSRAGHGIHLRQRRRRAGHILGGDVGTSERDGRHPSPRIPTLRPSATAPARRPSTEAPSTSI